MKRFDGPAGRRRAVDVLLDNPSVRGDALLAERLFDAGQVRGHATGDILIAQDHVSADVAFLLAGEVEIRVNDRVVGTRSAPAHVGEMAAIDPRAARSATVIARTSVVAAWVSEVALTAIGDDHPSLWRGFARVLADRLRARAVFHRAPNARPKVFVGSSVEGLPVARAVLLQLEHDPLDVRLWTEGTFGLSHYTLPDLHAEVDTADFAVMCLTPDDETTSRGSTQRAPRDNLLLEAGLFAGRLGYERVFLLKPRGAAMKLPSDLFGLSMVEFGGGASPSLTAAGEQLRRAIIQLGVR